MIIVAIFFVKVSNIGGVCMQDVVPFPNNAENYYRKAMYALEHHQFDSAEDFLLKSVELQHESDAFHELVRYYVMFKKNEALSLLWNTYYPQLQARIATEELTQSWAFSALELYPVTQALIELYRLRDHCRTNNWDCTSIDLYIETLNQQHELELQLEHALSQGTISQFVDELATRGSFTLLSFLKYVYTLDYTTRDPFYRTILKHGSIAQYVKSDILHYLIHCKMSATFDFVWFGKHEVITLERLHPYNEQTQFLETMRAIQRFCEQQDPHLYDEFIQQLTLQSMTFYPHVNEVLSNPQQWIDYMTGETEKVSPELIRYIHLANGELQALLEKD